MGCGIVSNLALEAGITPGVNVLEDVSTDYAGAGVSVKRTLIKKGQQVIQHKHAYPHLSILMSGVVFLCTDEGQRRIDARLEPQSIVIEADKYHAVIAVTNAEWLCVYVEGKV